MKMILLLAFLFLSFLCVAVDGQVQKPPPQDDAAAKEREVRDFYDSYAEDLRRHRTEAIANRYDSRGYYSLGNGNKRFVSFDESKKQYTTQWPGPKDFQWKDLSFDVLSPNSASVVGLFDWTSASGVKETYSYTAVLTKQSGQWRIRVEDESSNSTGFSTKVISGDASTSGPYKYSLTIQPGTSIAAHRHSTERRMTIKSGRMFILIGDLETAKVQRLDAGTTFVVPANAWHVEWWETETVVEVETTAPSKTERAKPATPRLP